MAQLKIPLAALLCLVFTVAFLSRILHVQQIRSPELAPPTRVSVPLPLKALDRLDRPTVSCVPRDSVYFLKVPKCASTTSFQIFVTYGIMHSLTFALPPKPGLVPISPSILPPEYHRSPDGRYNMAVCHTQFNKEGARQVVEESAKYVAFVREPASRFESAWYYGNYERKFHTNLTNFIKASTYSRKQKTFLNRIANYFGVKDPSDRITEREMDDKAKELQQSFDLVMITERFDESLVLLKHLMCWETEDVAYVRAKVRQPEHRRRLTKAEKDKLRRINRQDVFLYKFFSKIFEEKVKAFGKERMKREVKEIGEASARFIEDCGAELIGSFRTVKTWKVKKRSSICRMITLNGVDIEKQLRKRQSIWVRSNLTYDLSTWKFT
ncbi:galactose-3-O-sulfotransferase 4-like [Penaeus chinensis]|uniref:galactose-3-O-sulfotransferase 4-like n=1 Tax=Penaeus chinensis TaxID=139456 RepID=UPI001FB60B7B|nr:galactose-3-O-sulfotransferase 4-like [Penaeus chinensis]